MKKFLLIIAVLLGCISVFAQPRSEQDAIQIAEDFFAKSTKKKSLQLYVVPQQKITQQIRKKVASTLKVPSKNSSCYIINDEANNRFVIVSADERMYEILGYSDNGCFKAEDAPDGLLFILNEYNQQYDIVNAIGSTSVEPQLHRAKTSPIAPLISTKWGQTNPYWSQCPQFNSTYCVSGCVATAMAQVMAYHKYPDNGQGGSLNYKSGELGIYQYMNFDSQCYDWSKMQDTYVYYYDENGGRHSVPERSDDENNEVAKLMHACGVSVFMDYNISENGGSGAYSYDIPYAMIHYFGYNPNIFYAAKNYYKRDIWDSLIIEELKAKRPILYSGRGSVGGHQFVLDGVDGNGRYHFNFGWNGSCDGYFELDAISPSIYNFSSNQSMILLITKDVVGTPSDVFYTENFTLGKSAAVGSTIKARFNPYCYSNSSNTHNVKFSGEYGVGVFDKGWNFVKSLYSRHEEFYAWSHYYYTQNIDVRFDATTFTDNSMYYIALYAQSSDSEKPTLMRTSMGANDWYRAITKNGVVTLDVIAQIPDEPGPEPEPAPKPLPLTGNLKVLALDKAGDYKIWDVAVIKDGSDSKKYWFKGFDQIVTERGYTSEQNQNTIYGIYGDDGSFTIPVPQQMGENLFLNNFSAEDGLNVVIAQDGGKMIINETWGTVERKKSGDNTSQENVSVYTSTTFYPSVPVPIEKPIIVVDENHIMTIACGTEDANIYYTLDETTPLMSSVHYTDPTPIKRNLTIKAVAIKDANISDVAQFVVNDYVVPTPSFTLGSESVLYIVCEQADQIYYTTDGTTPTKDSELYPGTEPMKFDKTTTVKAIGTHDGWKNSEVAEYEYVVIPNVPEIVVLDNVKGQLAKRIPSDKKLTAKSLTITGELDGTDITVIREMMVDGNVEYLNIKGCTIKAGGENYPYLLTMTNATEDNVIGRYMFSSAKHLNTIVLPDNTIKVCYGAFYDCDLLKEVTIPEGCVEIEQAFTFCENLKTVNLPNSLVTFASNNFAYCPCLSSINIGDNNNSFKSVNGVLYSKDGKTLIRFANNNSQQYSVLDETTTIGNYAFYCSNAVNVVIPSTVASIEMSAFKSSKKLTEVILPYSVEKIGVSTFQYCSNLASVTLSSQITSIPSEAFLGCASLKNVILPENIKDIDRTAFNYCYSLQRFEVDNANPYLCSDNGVVYTKDKTSIVRCPIALYSENFKIQDGVENIGDNAFMGCTNIEKFTLPLSVDSIGQHAFENCSMSNIQLSDSVKFVGYQAFSDCDSLKTFVLPDSLKVIAESMFIFDYALSYVKIHADVTKISRSAFRFCRELSTIECDIKNIDCVEVGNLAFDGIPDNCTWYIPFGTEDKYKACSWWVSTWNIIPLHKNLLTASSEQIKHKCKPVNLSIELTNDDVIRMLQFELRLPAGVSVVNDNDNYAIELSDRAKNSHTFQCTELPNGNYQFVLLTKSHNNISGNEDDLAYVTIKADEDVKNGFYEAYLSNVELTVVDDNGSLKTIRPNDTQVIIAIDDAIIDVQQTTIRSVDIWYTLQGARLIHKPSRKGIYLHNGRKVMVK